MNSRITVVLADDHDLFREGIAGLLAQDSELVVVGEAGSGPETVELISSLRPDVLLLDVEMPGASARSTISSVRRICPTTQIIVLTMHRDSVLKRELLAFGAADYLTKTTPAADLIAAIHSAMLTGCESSKRTSPPYAGQRQRPHNLLSDREIEVLHLMASAQSNNAIAEHLSITVGTVKRHASNIYQKLGASSRMDAVQRGYRIGLLSK